MSQQSKPSRVQEYEQLVIQEQQGEAELRAIQEQIKRMSAKEVLPPTLLT